MEVSAERFGFSLNRSVWKIDQSAVFFWSAILKFIWNRSLKKIQGFFFWGVSSDGSLSRTFRVFIKFSYRRRIWQLNSPIAVKSSFFLICNFKIYFEKNLVKNSRLFFLEGDLRWKFQPNVSVFNRSVWKIDQSAVFFWSAILNFMSYLSNT